MNETLYSWTFKFHKVVRQQNSGAVEDFILPYSAVYLRNQKWKNYWNRSTFAKVIVKIKVAPFLMAHGVLALVHGVQLFLASPSSTLTPLACFFSTNKQRRPHWDLHALEDPRGPAGASGSRAGGDVGGPTAIVCHYRPSTLDNQTNCQNCQQQDTFVSAGIFSWQLFADHVAVLSI